MGTIKQNLTNTFIMYKTIIEILQAFHNLKALFQKDSNNLFE